MATEVQWPRSQAHEDNTTKAKQECASTRRLRVTVKGKGGCPKVWEGEALQLMQAEVLSRLAEGETLTDICRDPEYPATKTVREWVSESSLFGASYALARVAQMQQWADEIISIADDDTLDVVTKRTPQGREYEALDQQNVQRARLRIDTRKFLMAKIAPALYGDRVQHEVTGMVAHEHSVSLTDRERMRRFALFLSEDQQAGAIIEAEPVAVDIPSLPASEPEAAVEQPGE